MYVLACSTILVTEGWLEIDKHYSLELCFSIEKQPETVWYLGTYEQGALWARLSDQVADDENQIHDQVADDDAVQKRHGVQLPSVGKDSR